VVRKIPYKELMMVNVCDEDLLGRRLSDGELSVDINPDYFSGEVVDLETAVEYINEAAIVNMVGNAIVDEVLTRGLAHPGAVRRIGGVSFLMIFKFMSESYGREATLHRISQVS